MLLGEYRHSVDRDGRVVIPKRLREEVSAGVLAKFPGPCLSLWSHAKFEDHLRNMKDQTTEEKARSFVRVLLSGSDVVELDGKGRLSIPHVLRYFSGIDDAAVLVGVADRLEIWSPSSWQDYMQRGEGNLRDLLEDEVAHAYDSLCGPDGKPISEGSGTARSLIAVSASVIQLLESGTWSQEQLYALSPEEFEELVAELLAHQGFIVTRAPRRADRGVDLYLARNEDLGSFLYVVQCKRNRPDRPVGPSIVRELWGTISLHNATAGMLVTTATYTRGARREAAAENMRWRMSLKEYSDIDKWLREAKRGGART